MEYVAAYIQVQVMGVCRVYACMYGGGYIQGRHATAAAVRRREENLMGAVTTDQAPIP